jgi:hypothetical protein
MSRAAHADAPAAFDNPSRLPTMTTTLDSIQELLDGAPAPSLASLEGKLTAGYAQALTIEGERLRLERELRALVRAPGPPTRHRAAAISDLGLRVDDADRRLRQLRRLLASLRGHVVQPRA